MNGHQDLVGFIWSIAELLRGDYRQSEYGRVILPFTVLRRLDCVLEPSREKVRAADKKLPKDEAGYRAWTNADVQSDPSVTLPHLARDDRHFLFRCLGSRPSRAPGGAHS